MGQAYLGNGFNATGFTYSKEEKRKNTEAK